MRFSDTLMRDLRKEFSASDVAFWMLAWEFGPESISALAESAKSNRHKAENACKRLAGVGWMTVSRDGRSICPEAIIPHATQKKLAADLETEYEAAPNRGEFLMKAFLDLAVYDADYIDNARLPALPGAAGESLELDRYFRAKAAFEFNGPQHFGPTPKYDDPKAAVQQQARDTRKVWLCENAGIELVRVSVADLHPVTMGRMLPDRLRKRPIDQTGPYFLKLRSLCEAYVNKATSVSVCEILNMQLGPLPH